MMRPIARRLALQFDLQMLVAEYHKLEHYPWIRHPATKTHNNAWYAIPLFSVNGEMQRIADKAGEFRPSHVFLETQAFKQVLEFFQCPLKRVRILILQAGGIIREHVDNPFYGDQETVNLHVPILTNNDVQFVVGGRQLHMWPGECWYIDVSQPHSVTNRGVTDRIHLVLHGVKNRFIEELLTQAPLILHHDEINP